MTRKIIKNKSFLTVLNLLVACLAIAYIVYEIRQRTSQFSFFPHIKNYVFALAAFFLVPLNLGLEAQKWRLAVKTETRIDLLHSLFYVISSLPYGIITPSRIGEWYGRSRDFKNHTRGFLLSSIPGIAQQVITVIMGGLGLILLGHNDWKVWLAAAASFAALSGILVFLFYKLHAWNADKGENLKVFIKLLLYSLLRYIVFASQYLLLLKFFGINAGLVLLYSAIAVGYLVSYFLPLNAFVELSIRGGTVIYILSTVTTNLTGILWATASVWFINIALPAIVGSGLLLRQSIRAK